MNPLYIAFPIFWLLVGLLAFWVIRHDRKVLKQCANESAQKHKKSKRPIWKYLTTLEGYVNESAIYRSAYFCWIGMACSLLGSAPWQKSAQSTRSGKCEETQKSEASIMTIFHSMRRILCNAIRLYFAPLTGAYCGVRDELSRIHRQQHQDRWIKWLIIS